MESLLNQYLIHDITNVILKEVEREKFDEVLTKMNETYTHIIFTDPECDWRFNYIVHVKKNNETGVLTRYRIRDVEDYEQERWVKSDTLRVFTKKQGVELTILMGFENGVDLRCKSYDTGGKKITWLSCSSLGDGLDKFRSFTES